MPGRRMVAMLVVVLSVVAMLAGYKTFWIKQQLTRLHAPKPPVSVAVAPVIEMPWQPHLPAAGTLKALQGIDLSIEVPGVVTQVKFESGQTVTAGQSLVQLDNDMERAQQDIAQANRGLARQEFERGKQLVGIQAISNAEFDRLSSELNRHNALVNQSTVALAKKHLTAPFSGTIGIRQVNVGDYLQSTAVVASLQDTSILYVDFHVPEQAIQLIEIGQSIQVQVSARPGQHSLATVSAINPIVDDNTRNVRVRATLHNPHNQLLPGMFASLQVQLAATGPQIVVPEGSIIYSPFGQYVYVVSHRDDVSGPARLFAEQRAIKTGERRHGQVIILEGLKPGEQVVMAGQQKLEPGTPIKIGDDVRSGDTAATP